MKRISIIVFISLTIFPINLKAQEIHTQNPMILHPEWYINVLDWSLYSAWGGIAVIHHVTIENTSDIAYKDIAIRVFYYSYPTSDTGTLISQEIGVLPITLPPHSKCTYLKSGATLGASSMSMYPGSLEVLGAVPLLKN
jgi:hypothetical protein